MNTHPQANINDIKDQHKKISAICVKSQAVVDTPSAMQAPYAYEEAVANLSDAARVANNAIALLDSLEKFSK